MFRMFRTNNRLLHCIFVYDDENACNETRLYSSIKKEADDSNSTQFQVYE